MNNEQARTNRLVSLVNSLENNRFSFPIAALTFLSIVFGRAFLEGIFERSHTIGLHPITEISLYNVFLHFPVYFLFVFLACLVFLRILTRESMEKVGSITLAFFPLILLPPFLDLLITQGKGETLIYLLEVPDLLKTVYGTFLFPVALKGVSYGIRIEVLLACTLSATYVFIKAGKIHKILLTFLGIYSILLLSGALPLLAGVFLSLFKHSSGSPYFLIFQSGGLITTETQRATLVFLLPLLPLAALCLFLWSGGKFRAMLRNIRWPFSIHYIGMAFLGILMAFILARETNVPFVTNPLDYIAMLSLFISLFLLYQSTVWFTAVMNSRGKTDSRKEIGFSPYEMSTIALLLFVGALAFAVNVSYVCFLFTGALALVFFFSIAPPFRLERFFPVSTMLLSFSSLIAVLCGFSLFAGEKAAFIFPARIAWTIILLFTLGFSVKDLTSVSRDRVLHYHTIPTMLGAKRGRWVIAAMVSLGFLAAPLILRNHLLYIPALLIAGISILLIFKGYLRNRLETLCSVALPLFMIMLFLGTDACLAGNSLSSFLASRNYLLARDHLERGNTGEALACYESATRGGYEHPDLYRNMGLLYLKGGSVPKAIEAFEIALARNPDDQETRILLVQALNRSGAYDRAIAVCEQGIAAGRYRAEFLMLKGEILLVEEEIFPALNAFKRSVRAGENTGNSLMAMGSIYLSLDSLDRAIGAYTQALCYRKESPIFKARAEAYFRKGEEAAALADLLSAEELDPADPEIKNNIGIIHYRRRNYGKAEQYLLKSISLDSKYLVAYENLLDTYKSMGENEKAARVQSRINEMVSKEQNNE